MDFRYAICNETFEGWDHARVCRFVAGLGYTGLELAPFTLAPRITDVTPARRRELRQQAEGAGITILGLHWLLAKTEGLHLTAPDEAMRQRTADYLIELARACRDLQKAAKERGEPWDTSKGFDFSAPVAAIRPASAGHVSRGRIWLSVNGTVRQESDVSRMIWDVPQIIAALSRLYELRTGDLIFTGTPSGIGALKPGDVLEGGIEGLEVLRNTIAPPAPG